MEPPWDPWVAGVVAVEAYPACIGGVDLDVDLARLELDTCSSGGDVKRTLDDHGLLVVAVEDAC